MTNKARPFTETSNTSGLSRFISSRRSLGMSGGSERWCSGARSLLPRRFDVMQSAVMITHVVVFWTDKPPGEAQEKIAAGARELLAEIPGALEFRSGIPVPSTRGVVDDSFAAAISMTFEDQSAADTYLAQPDLL